MGKRCKRYINEDSELMQEWDNELNFDIDATKLTRSSKVKVNWKCKICGYKWESAIYNRTYNHTGCPRCANSVLLPGENDLATTNPQLAEEWNVERNGELTPRDIRAGSHQKVWWICKECKYEWEATINNRDSKGSGCPNCKKYTGSIRGISDLATTNPELTEEWNTKKNGNLTPKDIKAGSNKKVWWICSKCRTEWKATVNSRVKGAGCPHCIRTNRTSFPEQAIYFYVKQLYPDALNGFKSEFLGRMELDIFIPSIRLAIEYDGKAWHKEDKLPVEQEKYKKCRSKGIKVLRIRENSAKLASDIADIQMKLVKVDGEISLEETIKDIIKRINYSGNNRLSVNLLRDELVIRDMYQREIKKSLANLFPEIAMEWHPTKNGELTPTNFHYGSDFKAWWKCSKCDYEWKSTIKHRTRKYSNGCPVCGHQKRVVGVNDLATTHPELAKEWHPIKNGNIKASDVISGNGKKFWWKCSKCNFEWEATIVHRKFSRSGCPLCANAIVVAGVNDLKTKFPIVAQEWDYEKNLPLIPSEIHSRSNKKVWWICSICGKSWQATVASRTTRNRDGCRNCNSTKVRRNKYN